MLFAPSVAVTAALQAAIDIRPSLLPCAALQKTMRHTIQKFPVTRRGSMVAKEL